MARKSGIDQILTMVDSHPALAGQPMAIRFLWLRLARMMHSAGISVLRFGSVALPTFEIALQLAISETELEANLEPLIARELLTRDEDGAIGCPMLARFALRSEINRINGLKGGRPPKRPGADGQASMLLPITGGGTKAPVETERKPNARPARPAQLASYSESEIQLASDMKAEAGIQGEPVPDEVRLVAKWLRLGATEEMLFDLAKKRRGVGADGLFYFSKAVTERLATEEPMSATKSGVELPARNPLWAQAVEIWKAGGARGPVPQPQDYVAAA
jgi:hypothetical protein